MKEGKTEVLFCGTSKRLNMQSESFQVNIDGITIRNTDNYKYLGIYVNSSLDLNSHSDKPHKKAAGRWRLRAKLRKYGHVFSQRNTLLCNLVCFYIQRCAVNESL